MSDYEDGRRRSTSRGDRGGGGGGRRPKYERGSPSPPPSHSRHGSSRPAARSRSTSRDREKGRRDDGNRSRGGGGSRWERSRSRERMDPQRNDRDRERRRPSRDRDQPNRVDEGRIKQERRSPSPRFRSPPRPDRRRGDDRRENRNNNQSGRERPRDGVRERDWDNFFNPKSEMSREAFTKREKEEQDRQVAIGEFGKEEDDSEKPKEKEQPNFGLSGKLTEETNTFRGVVVKYSEPPEARKPNKIRWRLYPFKGEEALPVMYVHRQSVYLLGRDRKVADIPVDHPSCSKQHAVLQYRLVPYTRADGSKGRRIKPYIIDLESANGTYVNGKQVDAKRYVELFEKDVLKFGYSSREYVLLHDESRDIQDDSPELTPD